MKKKVTIKDVAKASNCSISTVSYVIKGDKKISPQTRNRVLSAITKLNYTPNVAASMLASKIIKTVGVFVPELENNFTNFFYLNLINVITTEVSKKEYSVQLNIVDKEFLKTKKYISLYKGRRIGGAILLGHFPDDFFIDEMAESNIPFIRIGNVKNNIKNRYPAVMEDNNKAMFLAVKYLYDSGHRNMAYIRGSQFVKSSAERLKGFKSSLKFFNLNIKDKYIQDGDFSIIGGYQSMKTILNLNELPSAVITGNDLMALGAIQCCNEMGYKIPEDISIISIDDLLPYYFMRPFITAVKIPYREMSIYACDYFINLLLKGSNYSGKNICFETKIFEPELIKRNSVRSVNNEKSIN